MVFTKNIRIQAKDLKGPGEKIYIVMVFNEDAVLTTQAEYQYIAVWKVAPFIPNKPGKQAIDMTYVAKVGVCKAHFRQLGPSEVVDFTSPSSKVVVAEVNKPIQVAQRMDLVDYTKPRFDNLTAYSNKEGFQVANKISQLFVNMGIGLYDNKDNFSPIAMWGGASVQAGSSIGVQFTPNISIFVTRQYQEGQLFPSLDEKSSALWKHNLEDKSLPKNLVFNLVWNPDIESFELREE